MAFEPLLGNCNRTPRHRTTREAGDEPDPSGALLEALAAAEGVDPMALDPLYADLDADALDNLFAHRRATADQDRTVLCLTLEGKNACIRANGDACICDADGEVPF